MSITYNVFAICLQRGKDAYQHEKDEKERQRIGLLKRHSDEDGSDDE